MERADLRYTKYLFVCTTAAVVVSYNHINSQIHVPTIHFADAWHTSYDLYLFDIDRIYIHMLRWQNHASVCLALPPPGLTIIMVGAVGLGAFPCSVLSSLSSILSVAGELLKGDTSRRSNLLDASIWCTWLAVWKTGSKATRETSSDNLTWFFLSWRHQ